MKRQSLSILGGMLIWWAPAVFALYLTESLQINGFGTLGVSTNDSDEIQYRVYANQEASVGRGEFNFGLNTVAGLQLRYQVSDELSLTAQGVARYLGNDEWDSAVDWAYLNYDTPWDFSVRAGKFRFPIFQSSELAYVGYSRPSVRPALVFYGVGGYEHLLGVQGNYNTTLADFDLGLRGTFGRSENDMPPAPDGSSRRVESDNIKILSAKLGNEHFWVNLAYTDLTSDLTTRRAGSPLRDVATGDLRYVSDTPGAIAYVPREVVDDSVKVLKVLK